MTGKKVNEKIGRIYSINISKEKGEKKSPVKSAGINRFGIEGDGHAGKWHRQVSLLSYESIAEFNRKGKISAKPGDFAENITTEGIDIRKLKIGDKIIISEDSQVNFNRINGTTPRDSVLLEVTQLGKECKKPCSIYYQVGSCIMPAEGIFCRVVNTGSIRVRDNILIIKK
jgi:MOSC domain-containing protein YiiM